jgi:hypothetical protein
MNTWGEIVGFNGDYVVNKLGEVISLKSRHPKKLKLATDRYGYLYCTLYKQGKPFKKKVHRLVAKTFIPNPNGLPMINHKNEIKDDNKVENLEWCTNKYNQRYGSAREKNRNSQDRVMLSKMLGAPVEQYTLDGRFVKRYHSMREASRRLNICHKGISLCCKGVYRQSGGYVWKRTSRV